jgi:hypothetical protein
VYGKEIYMCPKCARGSNKKLESLAEFTTARKNEEVVDRKEPNKECHACKNIVRAKGMYAIRWNRLIDAHVSLHYRREARLMSYSKEDK